MTPTMTPHLGDVLAATNKYGTREIYTVAKVDHEGDFVCVNSRTLVPYFSRLLSGVRYATSRERETGEIDPDAEPHEGPRMDEPTEIGYVCVVTLRGESYVATRAMGVAYAPWWVTGVGWCRWENFDNARPALRAERETGKPLDDWLAPGTEVTEVIEYVPEDVLLVDRQGDLWNRSGDHFVWWVTSTFKWHTTPCSSWEVKVHAPITVATAEHIEAAGLNDTESATDEFAPGTDVTDCVERVPGDRIMVDHDGCLWKRDGDLFTLWLPGQGCWGELRYEADYVREVGPLTIATDEQKNAKNYSPFHPGADVTDRLMEVPEGKIMANRFGRLWKRGSEGFASWYQDAGMWTQGDWSEGTVLLSAPITIATEEQMKAKGLVEKDNQ